MDAESALLQECLAYLDGKQSLATIRGWLELHVDDIYGAPTADEQTRDLADTLWHLISERDDGARDEKSVRRELSRWFREVVDVLFVRTARSDVVSADRESVASFIHTFSVVMVPPGRQTQPARIEFASAL
jgi:hypothetical protein